MIKELYLIVLFYVTVLLHSTQRCGNLIMTQAACVNGRVRLKDCCILYGLFDRLYYGTINKYIVICVCSVINTPKCRLRASKSSHQTSDMCCTSVDCFSRAGAAVPH